MRLLPIYRLISWILIPPITLALTVALAARSSFTGKESLFWIALVGVVGYGVEAGYFFLLWMRHRTDFDVKNKDIRERLLKMSVVSLASIFVIVLFLTEAIVLQKILLAAAIINLLFVIVLDIFKMELSFHIGMLTILVFYATAYLSYRYIPLGSVLLLLTGLSRHKLKMHTLPELAIGFIISAGVYGIVLWM
jgi:hypothetical protein